MWKKKENKTLIKIIALIDVKITSLLNHVYKSGRILNVKKEKYY